ncbi:enoyl-CoA hydratase/isomerase family protein [Pontivivens ytuae]|uniref:Enoyl-CoA hydratase/isomerase family protein n=1 Tax=Pontivivens ytuae TaxID=2789856 RepID=A0A7S9LUE4_9RHOB|nr:enoyl-CoA hydratase/isomerase family protein [Pontivivens ytuae]QPH55437.1 enoyl-CoA hydratase/isomerase family protein [Pontivivens ytuae]
MIELDRDDPVARLTLAAPERRNALRIADMEEMAARLQEVEEDTTLRVLILTGQGSTFCAGADFAELEAGLRPDLTLTRLSTRIATLRVPVIGALNGGTFGAGLDLALACDFRIGVEGMKVAVPAAAIGVHYPGEAIARASARLGPDTARRLFLAAETLEGEAVATAGIVEHLVSVDELAAAAEARAATIARLAPLAIEGMKRSLNAADDAEPRVAACFASGDHAEALAARREKRRPAFKRA